MKMRPPFGKRRLCTRRGLASIPNRKSRLKANGTPRRSLAPSHLTRESSSTITRQTISTPPRTFVFLRINCFRPSTSEDIAFTSYKTMPRTIRNPKCMNGSVVTGDKWRSFCFPRTHPNSMLLSASGTTHGWTRPTIVTSIQKKNCAKVSLQPLKTSRNGEIKTRIMYKARLSYAQVNKYLTLLVNKGFLKPLTVEQRKARRMLYRTTEKGTKLLKNLEAIVKL